jgi:hypothetical protein
MHATPVSLAHGPYRYSSVLEQTVIARDIDDKRT